MVGLRADFRQVLPNPRLHQKRMRQLCRQCGQQQAIVNGRTREPVSFFLSFVVRLHAFRSLLSCEEPVSNVPVRSFPWRDIQVNIGLGTDGRGDGPEV